MSNIINFFSENASWLFGSGGAAALILALLKIWQGKGGAGSTGKPGNTTNRDNTTTTTTITQGAGPIEFGFGIAIVVAAIGGLFWIVGPDQDGGTPNINATDGSIVNQGDKNKNMIIRRDVKQ